MKSMRQNAHQSVAQSSRRQFLRQSTLLGVAAVASPYIIPSGVLAADGQPGANDRIGIAGIGIGRQGSSVLKNAMQLNRCRFVAVADVNLPRAKDIAEKYQGEAVVDYRKVLDRKDVDAIITATPEHWRGIIAVHSCQAGKDVYAEKPLSLTIHEGRMMVDAARKYQRVFQVGSHQRSMALNRAVCAYIREGKLGKITEVLASNYPSPWEYNLPAQPIPEGLDWELWCGPVPVVPYNIDLYKPRANPGWISFRPYSGGEMTGWGAHGLDQIQWALGMDDNGPVEVWTEGPAFSPLTYSAAEPRDRGEKQCNSPIVFCKYANGITVKFEGGRSGGGAFVGEKGRIDLSRNDVKSNPPEIAEEIIKSVGEDSKRDADMDHVTNWLDCIKSREKPAADVLIGHRSATVCHLGNIARWTGRKLSWDPVKEVFADAEANKYLDRERRKPYLLPEQV
jgi:predicted dehydrogenase